MPDIPTPDDIAAGIPADPNEPMGEPTIEPIAEPAAEPMGLTEDELGLLTYAIETEIFKIQKNINSAKEGDDTREWEQWVNTRKRILEKLEHLQTQGI